MIRDAFWTHDYDSGASALFNCLRQFYAENNHFLTIINAEIDVQNSIATTVNNLLQNKLAESSCTVNETIHSQSSLKFGLEMFTSEFTRQANMHARNCARLKTEIRDPTKKWMKNYRKQLEDRKTMLFELLSEYKRLVHAATKKKNIYYESCRKNEDAKCGGSPKDSIIKTIRDIREKLNTSDHYDPQNGIIGHNREYSFENDVTNNISNNNTHNNIKNTNINNSSLFEVAGLKYTKYELSSLLNNILGDLTLAEYKVPFLRSYHNVASGSMIATSARRHLQNDSFAYADKFGQALVDLEFLKPVGRISNKYESTHNSNYQLLAKFFSLVEGSPTPVSTPKQGGSPVSSRNSDTSTSSITATDSTEEHYIQAILELDLFRCSMEIELAKTFAFIDKIERERYDIIKSGMQKMLEIIHNGNDAKDKLNKVESNISATKDIAAFVSKYETGPFVPNVMVFQSYNGNEIVQTFGVDLQLSKFFVSTVLDWLETKQQGAGDCSIWINRAPLEEIYILRSQINSGRQFNADSVFRFFSIPVVISTFLQYFLELPESIIPFTVYESFNKLFDQYETPETGQIANLLTQIPSINQEILFRLLMFLRTLFDDIKYPELAKALAIILMRPRAPSALTMHDTHPQHLILLLLTNCQKVFASLASQNHKEPKRRVFSPNFMQQDVFSSGHVHSNSGTSMQSLSPTSNTSLRPLSLTFSPDTILDNESITATSTITTNNNNNATGTVNVNTSSSKNITGLGINSLLPLSKQSTPKTRTGVHAQTHNRHSSISFDSPVRRKFSRSLDLTHYNKL